MANTLSIPQSRSLFQKIHRRLRSISYQARGMLSTFSWPQKIRFLVLCLRYAKSVIKTDRFLTVDEHMSKTIDKLDINVHGISVLVPFKEMEEELNKTWNDGASLEMVRELFGNNEYVRKFKRGLVADVAFDIGSNRGFFPLVASALLKSKKIICVEPQKELEPVRRLLTKANQISQDNLIEYNLFCSCQNSKNSISVNQIMKENNLDKIDFLKMDVEGAEADIFSDHLEWLDHCKNISMEIHYGMAKVGFIPDLLRSKGFQCILTNLSGQPISEKLTASLPRGCAYLYASSDGQLI
ncbi:MAG TPA: FkbM family methyltransferase [Chlamydiales bacterium]|nr:FkbM family methyltransferase [Chlamydiales bacterium]